MKRLVLFLITSYAILWLASAAQSASPLRGMELYQNHCTECHTSQAHIRENRKGKSLAQVEAWIRRWAGELKLAWTDEEVKEVLNYLNSRYYKY